VGVPRAGGVPEGAGLTDFEESDLVSEESSLAALLRALLIGDSLGAFGGLSFTGVFACNTYISKLYISVYRILTIQRCYFSIVYYHLQ
jgi:hypothetical protein